MSSVSLRKISKRYDNEGPEVVKRLSLDVYDGEFMVFVGPSGCGKSTMLRMIAGLEDITDGDLMIDGVRANDIQPSQRGVAMVFQSYALYPHMTVGENMGFALKLAGKPKEEVKAAVGRAAEILQISHLLDRKPKALSGGQRQRVAIGRSIVRKPKVFLFDEPLSNLDAALRVQMRIELAKLHAELKTTMIYVTHDQVEAMTLGDRIAVFNGGKVEQVGRPLDLYKQPVNQFVGAFLGSPQMNFIECRAGVLHGDSLDLHFGDVVRRVPLDGMVPPTNGDPLQLGVRPEDLLVVSEGLGLPATVDLVEHLGDATIVYATDVVSRQALTLKAGDFPAEVKAGARIGLMPRIGSFHLFAADGRSLTRQ